MGLRLQLALPACNWVPALLLGWGVALPAWGRVSALPTLLPWRILPVCLPEIECLPSLHPFLDKRECWLGLHCYLCCYLVEGDCLPESEHLSFLHSFLAERECWLGLYCYLHCYLVEGDCLPGGEHLPCLQSLPAGRQHWLGLHCYFKGSLTKLYFLPFVVTY